MATQNEPRDAGSARSIPSVALIAALLAFGFVTLDSAPADAQKCPPWENGGQKTGKLQGDQLSESSGLAASRRHDGLLWTHNDSGNSTRLFLYRRDGALVAVAHVLGARAKDWEDMAIGPCSATSGAKSTDQCIYLADIGDNKAKRDTVRVLKFPEPDIPKKRPASIPVDDWDRIEFEYESGPRDAETLLVHPKTAKIYVVQKSNAARAPVFGVPNRPTTDGELRTAKKITELPIAQGIGRQVTAGDVSPDGREFTIRTYVKVYTFCAEGGKPFETAFSASPVISQPRLTIQSESLAYDADGDFLWFTSEGKYPPLVRMKRAPAGTEGSERGELSKPEPGAKKARRENSE